jgi:regulator of replication initiation timing
LPSFRHTRYKFKTIYDTIDPAGEKMQRKINNIMQNNPSGYVAKIDQRFTQSPQLSEKEQLELELNFKQLTNLSTMSEDTKLDLAKNPHTHWALLFSLAIYKKTKQRIDEETSTEKHTQHEANINSKEVRAMVVENKNTPNWILMFIAEHDPEVGKLAEKKLFERGYSITIKGGKVIVDTENGTGAWVWTKHKKSKASVENNFIVTAQTSQVQNLLQQIKQINTQIESLQKQQENLNRQKEQLGQQVDNARQRAAQEPNPNEFKDTTNYGQPKLSNIYKNLFRIIIGEQSQLEIGKEEEISEHADTFNEIKKNVEETGNVGMSVDEFGEEIAKVHLKEDPNYYKESSLKFSKRK